MMIRPELVWLRQFNVGSNSAVAVRLLERLEFLQDIELSADVLSDIPPHRVSRLRRQGERYFADGLRDISGDRRLAILAVCVIEVAPPPHRPTRRRALVGGRGVVPSARRLSLRRHLAASIPALRRSETGPCARRDRGTTTTLAVPRAPEDWLADRMTRMHAGLRRLANATRMGLLPGGSVEEGILRTDRTPVDPPADADELILDLYRRLPEVRITDILLEVDQATGFTDAFTHLRTRVTPSRRPAPPGGNRRSAPGPGVHELAIPELSYRGCARAGPLPAGRGECRDCPG